MFRYDTHDSRQLSNFLFVNVADGAPGYGDSRL